MACAFLVLSCSEDEILLMKEEASADSLAKTRVAGEYEEASPDVQFSHSLGVGYSYNAINGEYCNQLDLRCQVINLEKLEDLQYSLGTPLIVTDYLHTTSTEFSSGYGFCDYVQGLTFNGEMAMDIKLYQGEIKKTSSVLEKGSIYNYFCKCSSLTPKIRRVLRSANVVALCKSHPEILTTSFQQAVDYLAQNPTVQRADSFLLRYGTHLVTGVTAGGKLTLEISVDVHRFRTLYEETEFFKQSLDLLLWKGEISEAQFNRRTQLDSLVEDRCIFTAKGGNTALLNKLITMPNFKNDESIRTMVAAWEESLYFDIEHPLKNNIEMLDMTVIPLYRLIPDQEARNVVMSRSQPTLTSLEALFGNQNFVNTSFPATIDSVTCYIGGQKTTVKSPPSVLLVSGNRIVATLCKESIPGVKGGSTISVAYPIYDRTLCDAAGMAIVDGLALSVSWQGGQCKVDTLGQTQSKTLYMTHGTLSYEPIAEVTYNPSYQMIDMEWPGSIAYTGKINSKSTWYSTIRKNGRFYLNTSKRFDNLPNWTYDATEGKMVRDLKYKYCWNTNEINIIR